MWAKMAGRAWERPGPQASRECPASWGQGGAHHVLPPTRRLGQGGWCGRACRGPSVAWSSSWSNKSAERRPKPRASHAWAQCPPFSLSLLIYEMGVLLGGLDVASYVHHRGLHEYCLPVLLERRGHLWSCSSWEGQSGRRRSTNSAGSARGEP